MDKVVLEAKKSEVEKEFNNLEEQKQQIIQRQYELRGSYQTYEKEIAELDPAKTIVAKPERKKNAK